MSAPHRAGIKQAYHERINLLPLRVVSCLGTLAGTNFCYPTKNSPSRERAVCQFVAGRRNFERLEFTVQYQKKLNRLLENGVFQWLAIQAANAGIIEHRKQPGTARLET